MANLASYKMSLALTVSIVVGAALVSATTTAFAAAPPHQSTAVPGNNPEGRIKHLHDQLKITPAEEAQWQSVAQVMLDNASAMKNAMKDRADMKTMTVIDDLRTYQAIVEAHADGIKKLAIAFKPLYASMSEKQQKNADAVFGHRTAASSAKAPG